MANFLWKNLDDSSIGNLLVSGQAFINGVLQLQQAPVIGVQQLPLTNPLEYFGDGLDGGPVFDGSSTILGMVPVASVYTMTRDIFTTNCIINAGVTLVTNGYRLFCSLSLINNGTIHNNGGAGGAPTAGAASGGASTKVFREGGAGGAGFSGNGAGSTAVASIGTPPRYFTALGQSALAGNGGAGQGGGGDAFAGGNGGQIVLAIPSLVGPVLADFLHGRILSQSSQLSAGSGGGGGGTNGTTGVGGGGGGGGGIVYVGARTIIGTGAIQSRGGNGGNATLGNATRAGAGAGGGGGVVVLVYGSMRFNGQLATQTLDALGGTAGTAAGTAGVSGNGGNGQVIKFNLSGDGT
jgi:hypothetical protein